MYCCFIISDYIWAVNVWCWSCLWQWKVSQKTENYNLRGRDSGDNLTSNLWYRTWEIWHHQQVWHDSWHHQSDMRHIIMTWHRQDLTEAPPLHHRHQVEKSLFLKDFATLVFRSLLWRRELCRPRCPAHTSSWLLKSWTRTRTQKGHWNRWHFRFNFDLLSSPFQIMWNLQRHWKSQ